MGVSERAEGAQEGGKGPPPRLPRGGPHPHPHIFFTPFPAAGLGHNSRSDAAGALLGPESSGRVSVIEARYFRRIFRALDGSKFGGESEVGEDCTARDIQKISSNTILNSDSVFTCGDCAELPEGPSPPSSGSAIFDGSLFQSGKLVVSQCELVLRCLLRVVFWFQQGAE